MSQIAYPQRQKMRKREPKGAMGCLVWSETDPPLPCWTSRSEDAGSILWASTHPSSEDLPPNSTDLGYAQPLATKTYFAPKKLCANLQWGQNTFPLAWDYWYIVRPYNLFDSLECLEGNSSNSSKLEKLPLFHRRFMCHVRWSPFQTP